MQPVNLTYKSFINFWQDPTSTCYHMNVNGKIISDENPFVILDKGKKIIINGKTVNKLSQPVRFISIIWNALNNKPQSNPKYSYEDSSKKGPFMTKKLTESMIQWRLDNLDKYNQLISDIKSGVVVIESKTKRKITSSTPEMKYKSWFTANIWPPLKQKYRNEYEKLISSHNNSNEQIKIISPTEFIDINNINHPEIQHDDTLSDNYDLDTMYNDNSNKPNNPNNVNSHTNNSVHNINNKKSLLLAKKQHNLHEPILIFKKTQFNATLPKIIITFYETKYDNISTSKSRIGHVKQLFKLLGQPCYNPNILLNYDYVKSCLYIVPHPNKTALLSTIKDIINLEFELDNPLAREVDTKYKSMFGYFKELSNHEHLSKTENFDIENAEKKLNILSIMHNNFLPILVIYNSQTSWTKFEHENYRNCILRYLYSKLSNLPALRHMEYRYMKIIKKGEPSDISDQSFNYIDLNTNLIHIFVHKESKKMKRQPIPISNETANFITNYANAISPCHFLIPSMDHAKSPENYTMYESEVSMAYLFKKQITEYTGLNNYEIRRLYATLHKNDQDAINYMGHGYQTHEIEYTTRKPKSNK